MKKLNISVVFVADSMFGCHVMYVNCRTFLTQNYCQCIQGASIGHVGNSNHSSIFLDLLPCLVLAFG